MEDPLTLQASEARAIAAVASTVGRSRPSAVSVEPLHRGVLVALGPGRYVNRAIGLGPQLDRSDIERIVDFFTGAGVEPAVQLSSRTDAATLGRLSEAGFRPSWFRSLFAGPLPPASPLPTGQSRRYSITTVAEHTVDSWLEVFAAGSGATTTTARAVSDEWCRAVLATEGIHVVVAADGGRPVGCGTLQVEGRMAWLGGAATVPEDRGRGVQATLLAHRLDLAASLGCDVVAATALPSGTSARNLHRAGLMLVDSQLVLTAS